MLIKNLIRYLRFRQYELQKGQADRVSCFYKTLHSYDYLTETMFFQALKEKTVFTCASRLNHPINTKGIKTFKLSKGQFLNILIDLI